MIWVNVGQIASVCLLQLLLVSGIESKKLVHAEHTCHNECQVYFQTGSPLIGALEREVSGFQLLALKHFHKDALTCLR